MSTHYHMHTQLQTRQSSGNHLAAFLAAPVTVFAAAYAIWTTLKQQCAALTSSECLSVGSAELGGNDVALLATFLAAGVAALIEVATI